MDQAVSAQPSIGTSVQHRLLYRGLATVIFAWLLLASGAVLPSLMTGGGAVDFGESEKSLIQNLSTIFLAISLIFLALYSKEIALLFLKNKALVLLLLITWLSYFWSNDPSVTVRRSLLLTAFTLIACVAVLKLDLPDIIRTLLYLSFFIVGSSIIFLIVFPELGFNPDGRGARGVFLHKNIFSIFLVTTLVATGAAIRLKILPQYWGYGYLALCCFLLILTNSATAWVVALITLAVHLLIKLRGLKLKYFLAIIALGVAAFFLLMPIAIINLDVLFASLDRDPTLTGRDDVWAYALRMIEDRMLLGYGYAAFWESEPFVSYVKETLNWHITHAHNGYLEVWLGLGFVGLGLIVFYYLGCVARLFLSNPSPDIVAFVLPMLLGLIAYNLAETQLMIAKDIGWLIMLICALLTTPGLAEIKRAFQSCSEGRLFKIYHTPMTRTIFDDDRLF